MSHAAILINLGSPDSPEEADVRTYLAQFLMDPYVIDSPFLIRFLVVYLAILPTRPRESGEAYAKIWTEDGSPLLVNSQALLENVQSRVDFPVCLGMRYGNPSIEATLSTLLADHPDLTSLSVLPLYPHHAMSSTVTAVEETRRALKRLKYTGETHIVPAFYEDRRYIEVLSESIREPLSQGYEYVLFSYHGLPERHLRKTDPTKDWCLKRVNCCDRRSDAHPTCYRHQAYRTTAEVVKTLKIPFAQYTVSFQSRLGKDPWIKPYTDEVLVKLAHRGIKKLHVVCPAFVADCLETLEEIQMEAEEIFKEAGGEELVYIPCLNADPAWSDVVAEMVLAPR